MSGYNILVRNTSRGDLDRLKEHFRRNPPGISVIFLEPNFINELREVSPNTLYILRDAPPGHGTDDEIYDKIDGVGYVNYLHGRAPAGAALYLGNEPFHLDRIVQWTLPALDRCDQLGRRAVVLNLSPGRPEVADWTSVLAPLLQRMNGTNHIMGLHEYWAKGRLFQPWWVGRAKFLYEACDQLGVTRPPIAYTEIGMLAPHPTIQDWLDPLGGWRKLGISPDEYADSLTEVYRVYEGQETALGAAIFCVGTWNGCEIEPAPRLFERLEMYEPMPVPTPPPTQPTPTPPAQPQPEQPPQPPPPVAKPANAGDPVQSRVTRTSSFEFINMRSGPNTNYEKRGEIRAGDVITYFPATRRPGGVYEWMYVTKTGAEGWFAFGLVTLEPVTSPPPVTPPPVTPPPVTPPPVTPQPPTNFTVTPEDLAKLEALSAQVADIQRQIAEVVRRIRR
jgi:hypothetical protein